MLRFFTFLLLLFALLFYSCKQGKAPANDLVRLSGQTMGTTYTVLFVPPGKSLEQARIDSILEKVNEGLSTYIPTSVISRFNQEDSVYLLEAASGQAVERFFDENFLFAVAVAEKTMGSFDPTVMPLVNYWGFGYTPKEKVKRVDSLAVDSLLAFVGLDKVKREEVSGGLQYRKEFPGVQLDFSALAKGYGVDVLGSYLEKEGIQNYLVEIGGEVRCRGKKSNGQAWRIGINTPSEKARLQDFEARIQLLGKSMATSGNYRNFYEVEGVKYSHTINPKTGFPERSRLLSATVLAEDCMTADAYATAFMVMGLEKAFAFAEQAPELESLLIYSDEEGEFQMKMTKGINELLVKGGE
jgi:thiamine biosynthesis lipoprotein